MSFDIYPVRLYWDGRQGCARANGVHVNLQGMPRGLPWAEVDYAPGAVASVRPHGYDARTDMTADDIVTVLRLLERMSAAARGEL